MGRARITTAMLGAVLLLAALAGAAGCGKGSAPTELRVGVISYTGAQAESCCGDATMTAAQLIALQAGQEGGVEVGGGRRIPLRLFFEEIPNRPEEAVAAAERLITVGKVAAIIGPQHSAEAIAVGELADSHKIPFITPMATNPRVTAGRRFVFRVAFTDDFEAGALADFVFRELQRRRAAVLFNADDAYCRNIAEVFSRAFTRNGGEVVAFESYPQGATDFSLLMRTIRAKSPQLLLLPNHNDEVAGQGAQALRAGIDAVLLGGTGWNEELLAPDPAFEGAVKASPWSALDSRPKNQAFLEAYRKMWKRDPAASAALTTDAFQLLFRAVKAAGSTEGEALIEALREGEPYDGLSGIISYRAGNDPPKPLFILRFQDGHARFLRRYAPDGVQAP